MYKLSIVIPTKNRYDYLFGCLNSLSFLNPDFTEIVVQDNSDCNDLFLNFIKSSPLSNLKYFYNKESIPISQNSDLAISNSVGEYICYIGDDDSVHSIIEDIVLLLSKYGIDACSTGMSGYYWPDVDLSNNFRPYFHFKKSENNFVKVVDTKSELKKCLSSGMQHLNKLPRVYHSLLSRSVLDKIYTQFGTFFPGPSPDMANACASCLFIDNHIFVDLPIVLSGTGYQSVAGMSIRGEHKGNLDSVKHLTSDVDSIWPSFIPKLWSAYTIWPVSAICVLPPIYLKLLNTTPLYTRLLLKHPESRRMLFTDGRFQLRYLSIIFESFKQILKWFKYRVSFYVFRLSSKHHISDKAIDISSAVLLGNDFNRNININDIENTIKNNFKDL